MSGKSLRLGLCGAAIALGGTAAACSQNSVPVTVRNLDRPSEVAFGCYGDLRITSGEAAGELRVSAQPMASCDGWRKGEIPAGQEDLQPPKEYGFLLQGSRGTIAVVDPTNQVVLDSDPLTPGKNATPIGTLPVGLTRDASGCFMISASAATCELAVLDVSSVLNLRTNARIARVPILNSNGEHLLAKARNLVGGTKQDEVGAGCPARPSGPLYLAYPACHLVAVVNAENGEIQDGIQFAADGTATLTGGAITCPSECAAPTEPEGTPDGGPPEGGEDDDTTPRPVVVKIASDGRLYVAAENSARIAVVDLDPVTGLPVPGAINSIELKGAVGVTSLAVSEPVVTGGEGGLEGSGPTTRYLYAVATDRTVRVVDVGDVAAMVECDTQVDPRFVHDVRDVSLLACFPVDGASTPPQRRPGAISPGIRLPGDDAPLDVAFSQIKPEPVSEQPGAHNMSGTFAFVTSTRGNVFVVNVDDDVYPDFEQDGDPAAVSMPLALAHQLRDQGSLRDAVATSCGSVSTDTLVGPPRASAGPTRIYSTARIAPEKLHLTPSVRQLECMFEGETVPVSELAFTAPVNDLELTFPDWATVRDEQWSVIFEGTLSRDTLLSDVDGPPVRAGTIEVDQNQRFNIALVDPSGSFCQMGVEPHDMVQLLGCDPALGDTQCGLGETCYVHPDTPTSVTTGVCLPMGRTEQLAVPCKDFLTSRRLYSAGPIVSSDRVMLEPRRRVLRTSPLDGCVSDEQCMQMAEVDEELADPQNPVDITTPPAVEHQWVCRNDPSRPPGPYRCLMACDETHACEPGSVCLAGYCNEGYPPGQECVRAVQRYQVRASDAFVVIGSSTGYLHNRMRDPATGECVTRAVDDADYNPLLVGRVPLRPPPCTDTNSMTDVSPNPCSLQMEQTETVAGSECLGDTQDHIRTPMVEGVQLQNPAFRLHLVDTETKGDATCNGDRAGELPPFSTAYTGFEIDFTVIGGLSPMRIALPTPLPAYPVRIELAPDGRLWILDQGDSGQGDAGRVFTVFPAAAAEPTPFSPTQIR